MVYNPHTVKVYQFLNFLLIFLLGMILFPLIKLINLKVIMMNFNKIIKLMISFDFKKINMSSLMLVWMLMFFFCYSDFLNGFLHFYLLKLVMMMAFIFFIFSLLINIYSMNSIFFGWDKEKNLLINFKLMLFELMTVFSRPMSLTLRLSINLMIGHILSFLFFFNMGFIMSFMILLLETLIIMLQVTVFVLLIDLYISE